MKALKFLIYFFLLSYCTAFSQTSVTDKTEVKKGYLPKAGNFGIGTEASPVFDYIGNLLSNAGTNTLDLSIPSVYLKYYVTDMSAVRAILKVNTGTTKSSDYIQDDAAILANPLSNAQVTDIVTAKNNDIGISLAWQRFIGKNRLRGFCGVQILSTYNSLSNVYSYGNPMSALNPIPTSMAGSYFTSTERLLENKVYNIFKWGAGGIAGFEYYVLPQLCFGGEVSLNFIYSKFGQTYSKTETIMGANYVIKSTALTPAYSQYSFETSSFTPSNLTKQLGFYVMFHF